MHFDLHHESSSRNKLRLRHSDIDSVILDVLALRSILVLSIRFFYFSHARIVPRTCLALQQVLINTSTTLIDLLLYLAYYNTFCSTSSAIAFRICEMILKRSKKIPSNTRRHLNNSTQNWIYEFTSRISTNFFGEIYSNRFSRSSQHSLREANI